jgi:hypothetical protein
MFGRMKMLRRMAVGRIVATGDVTAHQAQPQVHPSAADREAFFAAVSGRRDVDDRGQMGAGVRFRHCRIRYLVNSFSIVVSKSMLTFAPPAALSSMVSLPASRCGVSVLSFSVSGRALPEYWTR